MKPIRDYTEGQWLILLWAFIAFFLLFGLFIGSFGVVVISVLGGAGAGYTTYLYVQNATGAQPPGSAPDSDSYEGGNR